MPTNPKLPEVVDTEHLRLQRISMQHASALRELFSDSDAMRFSEVMPANDPADALSWIGRSLAIGTAWHASWCVFLKDTQHLLGVIGYECRVPWHGRTAVSLVYYRRHSNFSLLVEALTALLEVCDETLRMHRIEVLLDTEDEMSILIFRKLEFVCDGLLIDYIFTVPNGYRDRLLYSRLIGQRGRASVRSEDVLFWQDPHEKKKDLNHSPTCVQTDMNDSNVDQKVLFAGPTVVSGNRLRTRIGNQWTSVTAPHDILAAIADAADGSKSISEIISSAPQLYDRSTVFDLVCALEARGILVPGSRLLERQWHLAANPALYPHAAPSDVARRLAEAASNRVAGIDPSVPLLRAAKTPFIRLLENRKTERVFGSNAITDDQLAAWLYAGYGVLPGWNTSTDLQLARRAVPSAGAIYPLALTWIQWRATTTYEPGVYRVLYGPDAQVGLQLLGNRQIDVIRGFINPLGLTSAHGALVLSADFGALAAKYGNRGLPYALLEAGHVAQNLYLSASECGLAIMEVGGFYDRIIKQATFLENADPVNIVIIGSRSDTPPNPASVERPEIIFEWMDMPGEHRPPFHLARARIKGADAETEWCWGRSRNPVTASEKALYEAVERFACHLPRRTRSATVADLQNFIDPRRFVCYPRDFYSSGVSDLVPFDETKSYLWTIAERISDQQEAWVLAELVYFPRGLGTERGNYTLTSSSGAAAFPNREGAIEHALLEVIERNDFMEAWISRKPLPKIALSSLPSDLRERFRYMERFEWDVSLLVMSQDPVLSVLAFGQSSASSFTQVAAASGFDLQKVVEHALDELEAMLIFAPGLQKFDKRDICPDDVKTPHDHAALYRHPRYFRKADWLVGKEELTWDSVRSGTANAQETVESLHGRGRYCWVVDMTPGMALPYSNLYKFFVARVLVEGMTPISFGYGMEPTLTRNGDGSKMSQERRRFPHPFA
jgi:ribosomal protein S12 methylthiotransferase accessory factor